MTKVKVTEKDGLILRIVINGHAGYAPHGEDLVCAGISAISLGALNALDEQFHEEVTLDADHAGRITIETESSRKSVQACLNMLVLQLRTLEEEYPKYIKITGYQESKLRRKRCNHAF